MFLFLLTIALGRELITSIPLNPSLILSISEIDSQTHEYTLTRDLSLEEGWFALGFPNQDNIGMDHSRAFICTDDGIKVYDIEQKTTMQSAWIQTVASGSCTISENQAIMTFEAEGVELDAYTFIWAMNPSGEWNPEAGFSTCWHGPDNKGQVTLSAPKEFTFINVYNRGAEQHVNIASAVDENIVTLPDGSQVTLNGGEVHEYMNTASGNIVKSTKPITVMGKAQDLSFGTTYDWPSFADRGTEFYFAVSRRNSLPRIVMYAFEPATVTVETIDTNTGAFTFVSNVNIAAGEIQSDEWTTVHYGLIRVQSTAEIIAVYFGNEDWDYVVGTPAASEMYGAASNTMTVVNPSGGNLNMVCADGQTDTWSNVQKRTSMGQAWTAPACRIYSTDGTKFSVQTTGDGSGGNSVRWESPDRFGTLTVLSREMKVVKIISSTTTACDIGGNSMTLQGSGIGDLRVTDVLKGTVIRCNDPVMIIADPDWRSDEANVPMFVWTDPCAACVPSTPVCAGNVSYPSPCAATCIGATYTLGYCDTSAPSQSPTTSVPTKTPTDFPTSPPVTAAPYELLDQTETIDVLKNLLAETSRHVMLQQVQAEHDLRNRGSSGVTRVRAYSAGTKNYNADGGIGNGGILAIHDHPNFHRKMGLGEFGAVLNGIRFDTRHNDYKIRMPAGSANAEYNELEDITYPDVPPSVLAQPTVEAQIQEMQQYFKAFKAQDKTIRDYSDYFKPVLCYLEGAWIKDTDVMEEFFDSDRHSLHAETWKEQFDAQVFRANSGKKHVLENVPFLPTKIVDVKVDSLNGISYPVYANFEYRIACQPMEGEIPTARFILDVDEAVLQKFARGRKSIEEEDLRYTRMGHFKVNGLSQENWDFNEERGREQTPPMGDMRWNFLDKLMEQVPGKNGPQATLRDNSFHITTSKYDDRDTELNTGFYSRFFSYDHADAMGRQQQMRGYNDQNLWAAMNTQDKVAGYHICQSEDETADDSEQCWEQKWTYAIPLEIIYLSPLENWNPYELTMFDTTSIFHQTNEGRDGSIDFPFQGYTEKGQFVKIPQEFFSGNSGRDLADTGRAYYVETDSNGVQAVMSSGTRVVTDPIGDDVGPIRLRWPIFPVHDRSSLAFREVTALGEKVRNEYNAQNEALQSEVDSLKSVVSDLLTLLASAESLGSIADSVAGLSLDENSEETSSENQVRKWTESTYPVPVLHTGQGSPENHIHDIFCDWNCFVMLAAGQEVTITSEDWDGHTHDFIFKLGGDNASMVFLGCDSCQEDPHNSINIGSAFTEAFLPF